MSSINNWIDHSILSTGQLLNGNLDPSAAYNMVQKLSNTIPLGAIGIVFASAVCQAAAYISVSQYFMVVGSAVVVWAVSRVVSARCMTHLDRLLEKDLGRFDARINEVRHVAANLFENLGQNMR